MASDGKQLEALVAYVENRLLPEGFDVVTNERIFNDEGIQIAEFDIEIRGKVGSTDIAWLIECRDRPTSGPAPGSWIEQLVGRRTRFRFNKVTAVSTTGFAAGAVEFALAQGIELREVKALAPEDFSDWLLVRHINCAEQQTILSHATLLVDESESEEKQRAFLKHLSEVDGSARILVSSTTGDAITTSDAFSGAARGINGLFDSLIANGPGRKIRLRANYTKEDHFVVQTDEGSMRVHAIIFEGEIRLKHYQIPLLATAEYRHANAGEVISQVASFAPVLIQGMNISTEIHKMADTGETHIVLRRLEDKS